MSNDACPWESFTYPPQVEAARLEALRQLQARQPDIVDLTFESHHDVLEAWVHRKDGSKAQAGSLSWDIVSGALRTSEHVKPEFQDARLMKALWTTLLAWQPKFERTRIGITEKNLQAFLAAIKEPTNEDNRRKLVDKGYPSEYTITPLERAFHVELASAVKEGTLAEFRSRMLAAAQKHTPTLRIAHGQGFEEVVYLQVTLLAEGAVQVRAEFRRPAKPAIVPIVQIADIQDPDHIHAYRLTPDGKSVVTPNTDILF